MSYNFVLKQLKNGTNLIHYRNKIMIWNIGFTKNELLYNLNIQQNINNNSFTRYQQLCAPIVGRGLENFIFYFYKLKMDV